MVRYAVANTSYVSNYKWIIWCVTLSLTHPTYLIIEFNNMVRYAYEKLFTYHKLTYLSIVYLF
jgi:hypothetical protein